MSEHVADVQGDLSPPQCNASVFPDTREHIACLIGIEDLGHAQSCLLMIERRATSI
jgi:hypothetical protein